jgi:NAD(P)-dependent dehydrogenase (short-subunit alcohol dehydrogenase family)
MTDKKVWFITGTSRGMGVDFAKAALAAGNTVVATGRNTDAVSKAVGDADDLLVVRLDVTSRADAESAVQAIVGRFGRIDVLVNNAANFYAGYFEELTPEQIEQQLATGLCWQPCSSVPNLECREGELSHLLKFQMRKLEPSHIFLGSISKQKVDATLR